MQCCLKVKKRNLFMVPSWFQMAVLQKRVQ